MTRGEIQRHSVITKKIWLQKYFEVERKEGEGIYLYISECTMQLKLHLLLPAPQDLPQLQLHYHFILATRLSTSLISITMLDIGLNPGFSYPCSLEDYKTNFPHHQ